MKFTRTFAALCAAGTLLAFVSCKDESGDGVTTGNKWALTMTVDATGDNIKVGGKAITDSNEMTEDTIVSDEENTNLSLSKTGKRFFKEISGGLNNTEGFRTNIVLDLANGTWSNSTASRTAGAGMIFDFYEYEKDGKTKTYDFFFLSFKPQFTNGAFTGVICYFERYSGVKKYKAGIYSSDANASALGSNYIQTAVGTWDSTLYTPDKGKTWSKSLVDTKDYTYDETSKTVTIGVDVKQNTAGEYTVSIGQIIYTLKDDTTQTGVANFDKAWTTAFIFGTQMGKGGDPAGTSCIADYTNWTHVSKDTSKNLKGGVMVYGFAPYGTKPVASYYTCSTKAASNATPDGTTDYVGDWNTANKVDTREGVKDYMIYEEGGVEHEYIYY